MENSRFFTLLESKLGDVRPLLSEQITYTPVRSGPLSCGNGFCVSSTHNCVNNRCSVSTSNRPTGGVGGGGMVPSNIDKYRCNGGVRCASGYCAPGQACSNDYCWGRNIRPSDLPACPTQTSGSTSQNVPYSGNTNISYSGY